MFFLLVSGVDFYFQISFMNQRPIDYTVQEAFFNSVFFWFAFVLIFPLITMRLFSEEFKLGTIEPLMTAPVRDWQVVLAKFFGALVFYIILWLPTLLYFAVFQKIAHQPAANSAGAYWGSYLMLLVARNVLHLCRLPRFRADEESNRRRDHFLLRHYAPFLSRPYAIHSSRCSARQRAQLLGYFSAHRTHGHVFARHHRYPADRSLSRA